MYVEELILLASTSTVAEVNLQFLRLGLFSVTNIYRLRPEFTFNTTSCTRKVCFKVSGTRKIVFDSLVGGRMTVLLRDL